MAYGDEEGKASSLRGIKVHSPSHIPDDHDKLLQYQQKIDKANRTIDDLEKSLAT